MKILVLGSEGYIGSRLISYLSSRYETYGLDIGWFSSTNNPIDFNSLTYDEIKKFDVIVLMAGHSSVKMCENSLSSAFNNNVRNFINLLSKISEKQKFIYASSSSVYGVSGNKLMKENFSTFTTQNNYDLTKYIIDLLSLQSNIEFYGLRFGTVNGYSKNLRTDVMINAMVYNAITNKEIILFNKNIHRPILGINDLCRAIETIIETKSNNRGLYNLASFSNTAEKIAFGISSIVGAPVKKLETNSSKEGIRRKVDFYDFDIDCSKFKSVYNFQFNDTIESLTHELISNFKNMHFSNRNENKLYE